MFLSFFDLPYAIEVLSTTVFILYVGYLYDIIFFKRELPPLELGITFSIIYCCLIFLGIFNYINTFIERKKEKVIFENSLFDNNITTDTKNKKN
jgi:hypothetical protein